MEIIEIISNIRWENMTPGTEFARDFFAGIGPLQLGVVLVSDIIDLKIRPSDTTRRND